ncbi:MAG: nucleoside hydrolase [Alphaproteobacteria bacterium]|nr:nucleoside hydrolase [Alphaproteobacteria bacterium]
MVTPAATATITPVIIDCDPGIDDAIALLLAFACPEALRVEAITTVVGNVPLAHTTRNAQRIRALANRLEIPVHAGCPRPILAQPHHAAHVHGEDGLGGIGLPETEEGLAARHAVDALADRVPGPDRLTTVAVGPLTNLAVLLIKRPELAERLGRVIVMGGGIARGNVTPAAEFNVFADPEAARIVVEAGLRPLVFPLDVTQQALVTEADLSRLGEGGGRVTEAAVAMLRFYLAAVGARHGGVHIHDAMALAYPIWPELFEVRAARMTVITEAGAERGRTVVDFDTSEPNADIAVAVDAPVFIDRVFERIHALDR